MLCHAFLSVIILNSIRAPSSLPVRVRFSGITASIQAMNLNHLSTSASAPRNKSGSLLNMTAVQLSLDEENERKRESAIISVSNDNFQFRFSSCLLLQISSLLPNLPRARLDQYLLVKIRAANPRLKIFNERHLRPTTTAIITRNHETSLPPMLVLLPRSTTHSHSQLVIESHHRLEIARRLTHIRKVKLFRFRRTPVRISIKLRPTLSILSAIPIRLRSALMHLQAQALRESCPNCRRVLRH
jgi:hypothetical protein